MKFSELFKKKKKILSFEFFPPKKLEGIPDTKAMIAKLSKLNPDFMTVTYGAGGGTKDYTKELTSYIANDLKVTAVSHLTCVGHSIEEIDSTLAELKKQGVTNILGLRGDPPVGQKFSAHPDGFKTSCELIDFINRKKDFSIAVAGYPEKHNEAKTLADDIDYLKRKINAGAEIVITQLFFSADMYLNFVNQCRKSGINVPILPGLMPIRNVEQVKRFTSLCGSSIPIEVERKLVSLQDSPEDVLKYGVDLTIEIADAILNSDAPGLHLFTLNRSTQVQEIAQNLRNWWQ